MNSNCPALTLRSEFVVDGILTNELPIQNQA